MKTKLLVFLTWTLLATTGVIRGQGTFQNLDFESALIPSDHPSPDYDVSAGVAFPGWSAYIGSNQASFIVYNNSALSAANISIVATNFVNQPALEGRFSAFLQGSGLKPNGSPLAPPEVSQRLCLPQLRH